MYGWLDEALESGAQVVTANRRLARLLTARFNADQLGVGKTAWPRPDIFDWTSWLSLLGESTDPHIHRDVRINAHQSRILWEDCLAAELSNPDANIGALVRLSREARSRLSEWRVPLSAVGEYARSDDERFFANALNTYVRLLERRGWVDDAGYAEQVLQWARERSVAAPARLVVVGFTSPTAFFDAMLEALRDHGTQIDRPRPEVREDFRRIEFLDEAQELRAAGAWARERFIGDVERRIAIVVSGLEGKAGRVGHMIREGFMPGWQFSADRADGAVNVSFGQALSDYPVIALALTLLRWMSGDGLSAAEVSILLRSRLVGPHGDESRIYAELKLRDMPDRSWTLALFARAFASHEPSEDLATWLSDLQRAAEMFDDGITPQTAATSIAELIDDALAAAGWPGGESLDSDDFQLLNRWRELLNDFARLSLVQTTFTAAQSVARLATMARETLFQPETEQACIHVLGALEASGSEFDELWVTGLTSRQWPPPARPLALVSTRLQKKFGMPDSTPANTAAYARRSLDALAASADHVTFSYSRLEDDAERTPSPILPIAGTVSAENLDPGWYAAQLVEPARLRIEAGDPAPGITAGERVWGGASTLDRQSYSPFDAFAFGRLGLRTLTSFSPALQAFMRGNLIHDALRRLYRQHTGRDSLAAMDEETRAGQIDEAVRQAMATEFRIADRVLRQVLRIEEQRMRVLLDRVIDHDLGRSDFRVESIEEGRDFRYKALALNLKADRIDALDDDRFLILDYKTGDEKKLLTRGELNSFQLVLYGLAYGKTIAAFGLYNVDSRLVGINGAGESLDDRDTWDEDLAAWSAVALAHLDRLIDGDVRINAFQSLRDSRHTALLSRVAELKRD